MALKKGKTLISQSDRKTLASFGDRVKTLREKKGLTVYDITGEDMPIKSRQHWQRIENGQKNVNLTTVFKMAQTLNVKIEDLFKGLT